MAVYFTENRISWVYVQSLRSTGRTVVSKDPISYAGGLNLYAYAPNPVEWIDALGLARCLCNPCGITTHSGQPSPRPSGLQSHHLIQDAWAKANVPGYSRGGAPAIILPRSPQH
ncbi:RHS repeat-associated core domain-containing protein [Pseudomonas lundensis]|uniref:RHS repeat-associated core domain-containing protein n=1 Tax=Pseudomonas lundensis TaxID=86185 RepID=UPI003B75CBAE